MPDPLCATAKPRAVRRAFQFPENATAEQVHRAKALCLGCPMLRDCAREALYSGSDLAGELPAPATGVVMAGVLCDGSEEALEALEKVAGIQGIYKGRKRPLVTFGTPCRVCSTPMVRWTPLEPPEGYAVHRGRGICAGCRKAYTEELEAWRRANPEAAARKTNSGKQVDRKRTSIAGLERKITTALKHGDEQRADDLRYLWSLETDRKAVRVAVSQGKPVVTLPTRGELTDRVLLELQLHPDKTLEEIAETIGCSKELVSRSRAVLVLAGVPGFEEKETLISTAAERRHRIRHAKGALKRIEASRRRKLALKLLEDRPDLSQKQIANLVHIDRAKVRKLAREHGIPIRPPGRAEEVPTASAEG